MEESSSQHASEEDSRTARHSTSATYDVVPEVGHPRIGGWTSPPPCQNWTPPVTAPPRPAAWPGPPPAAVPALALACAPASSATAYEIARVLGNSAGAVANALDRLVELGHAELASERPAATSPRPLRPAPAKPHPTVIGQAGRGSQPAPP